MTIRGRPIADIVPAGVASDDGLRELVAARRPAVALAPDARTASCHRSTAASSLVRAERDAER